MLVLRRWLLLVLIVEVLAHLVESLLLLLLLVVRLLLAGNIFVLAVVGVLVFLHNAFVVLLLAHVISWPLEEVIVFFLLGRVFIWIAAYVFLYALLHLRCQTHELLRHIRRWVTLLGCGLE